MGLVQVSGDAVVAIDRRSMENLPAPTSMPDGGQPHHQLTSVGVNAPPPKTRLAPPHIPPPHIPPPCTELATIASPTQRFLAFGFYYASTYLPLSSSQPSLKPRCTCSSWQTIQILTCRKRREVCGDIFLHFSQPSLAFVFNSPPVSRALFPKPSSDDRHA